MARRTPAARGGSVMTEPRGARCPPARKHAAGPGTEKSGGEPQRSQPRHAPALEPPQAARRPPRLSHGPVVSSPPRTSHSESFAGPALGTAPARGPWGLSHHGTLRRQTPTSAQARRRAGNGEERGEPQRSQPRLAPALEPPENRGAYARLSQGPMVCYSHHALPAGGGLPYNKTGADPRVAPYSMFWYNAHLQKQRPSSPPVLGGDVLGGEERRLLPSRFQKRYAACTGKRPGSHWPAGAPGAGVADGRGTVEDRRGGRIRPKGGCQSRL